jgi:hypothetical protein
MRQPLPLQAVMGILSGPRRSALHAACSCVSPAGDDRKCLMSKMVQSTSVVLNQIIWRPTYFVAAPLETSGVGLPVDRSQWRCLDYRTIGRRGPRMAHGTLTK